VGFRADLDTEARGKILCLCRGWKPGRPVCSKTLCRQLAQIIYCINIRNISSFSPLKLNCNYVETSMTIIPWKYLSVANSAKYGLLVYYLALNGYVSVQIGNVEIGLPL
jgi:hypothetical protein